MTAASRTSLFVLDARAAKLACLSSTRVLDASQGVSATAARSYTLAMAASTKVLDKAMKLPVRERVQMAEKLLESADAEGDDEDDATIATAWAAEVQQRSSELH